MLPCRRYSKALISTILSSSLPSSSHLPIPTCPYNITRFYHDTREKIAQSPGASSVDPPIRSSPESLLDSAVFKLLDDDIPFESRVFTLQQLLDRLYDNDGKITPSALHKLHQNWMPYLDRLNMDKYDTNDVLSTSLASLLVHYYTIVQNYPKALDTLLSISSRGGHVDRFTCDLLAFHLLSRGDLNSIYRMVSSMQRHQYPFHLSPPLADSWISKLVTERGNSDVLAKTFVNIICKSSTNLAPSYEALTRMAEFFANDLQFSVFGKIVKYTVDRMRIDEIPTGRVEEFKDSMTVCRFQGYVSKLGATQVITNGMFHTFGFSNGKKHQWRVTDLPLFVNKLASENPKMDYLTALKLLEQMHGYHVKEYPQRYSPLLHPDVQMARIYKGLLSRDPTNKEIGAEYKKVSESLKGNPASKFGKPTKMSNKFRNRASVTEGEVFKVLPLNVILKVISLTSNDLSMSLKLVRTMMKKHECRINNETMIYVLKIFGKNPEALGQFGAFFEGFRNDIVMNRQLYGIVIDLLIKGGDFERLGEVLRGYEKAGWFVSGEMCKRVNGASEGAGVIPLRRELVNDTKE